MAKKNKSAEEQLAVALIRATTPKAKDTPPKPGRKPRFWAEDMADDNWREQR